jgi:hypothetical protein
VGPALVWPFWTWVERRREQRRLDRGDPARTTDKSGWRQVLGLPLAQTPDDAARLQKLEAEAYKAIHESSKKFPRLT